MFGRYELKVSYKGSWIFQGAFTSINRAIKTASCFDDECRFFLFDSLADSSFNDVAISLMIKEFRNVEVLS